MVSKVQAWFQTWSLKASLEQRGERIVISGAFMALVMVWIIVSLSLMQARQGAIDAERRVLERMSLVVEEQARHLFGELEFFLRSANKIFVARSNAAFATDPELRQLKAALLHQLDGQADIRIHSFSATAPSQNEDETRRSAPAATQSSLKSAYARQDDLDVDQNLVIGMPYLERSTGSWKIPVTLQPTGRIGQNLTVSIEVNLNLFSDLYEQGRTKPNGSIALVHRDGTVLARAPMGSRLAGHSISNGEIWKKFLPKSQLGSAILKTTAIDHSSRLAAFAASPRFPLVVIASSAMEDVLTGWNQWARAWLTIATLLSLFIVAGAWRLISLLSVLATTRAQAEQHARIDGLTGLLNRRMFHHHLGHELKHRARSTLSLAVLYIDLDQFKEVNDTLGHGAGDMLLQQVAKRLQTCVREIDIVSRLGGDEFTVLLVNLSDLHRVEKVAEKILKSLRDPFMLNDKTVNISASIGITIAPQDASDIEGLLINADQAMYAAKNDGRNCWKFFMPAMQLKAQKRMQMISELRTAVTNQEFELHYQPIVDLKSGAIYKAEALLRWHHPIHGMVNPADFIPILEETGLIVHVGDWVFREAARQVCKWKSEVHPSFQVSVNMSPIQFKSKASFDWNGYLASIGLNGAGIAIEITEGLLLERDDSVSATLQQISSGGMQLSLDDFGTGYSSLAYLKKFDIDYLKIDRNFVSALDLGAEDLALCEAIIVMAHKLGIKVIAEGIETQSQMDLLTSIGCNYGQGFFFSKPLPATSLHLPSSLSARATAT